MIKLLSHDALRSQMQPGEVEVWRDTDDSPYTPEQIDAAIARYNNAETREAPVVIDHDDPPRDPRSGPQFGRIDKLRRIGAHTVAQLADVADSLKEWAKSHLRGRSMEFYEDHDGKEGELFPRALAFLGAQPPAIKGMTPAQFHEAKGVKVGSQRANDPVARLAEDEMEEDVIPKRRTSDAPALGEQDVTNGIATFSEKQVAALTQIVTAAIKPIGDRLTAMETRQTDEATSAFEGRIAQFREGLVAGGIVEPAKVDEEVAFARSLRGSVVTRDGKSHDGADAYMAKRLTDKATVPLGESPLGKIATFAEGPVKGDDGREHKVVIPGDATPAQKQEIEAIARRARKDGISYGAAQIELEREAKQLA